MDFKKRLGIFMALLVATGSVIFTGCSSQGDGPVGLEDRSPLVSYSQTPIPLLEDAAWDANGVLEGLDDLGNVHRWERSGPISAPTEIAVSLNGVAQGTLILNWDGSGGMETIEITDPDGELYQVLDGETGEFIEGDLSDLEECPFWADTPEDCEGWGTIDSFVSYPLFGFDLFTLETLEEDDGPTRCQEELEEAREEGVELAAAGLTAAVGVPGGLLLVVATKGVGVKVGIGIIAGAVVNLAKQTAVTLFQAVDAWNICRDESNN